jgi:type III pantothenate kinase
MLRIVADLGNTRMKWARLDEAGRPTPSSALSPDDPSVWRDLWDDWHAESPVPSRWAVASVNPPVAEELAGFLKSRGVQEARWFRTAAEVPIPMDVVGAETGGADRALAVLAAKRLMPGGQPGVVVSCGTAITLERIDAAGVWVGGVIAPGLFLSARALHLLTAQLPLIHPDASAPSWGRGTLDCLEAGIFWGAVGAVRELLARQTFEGGQVPWVLWTGGDAERLARPVSGDQARIIPDLVLRGLAFAAF